MIAWWGPEVEDEREKLGDPRGIDQFIGEADMLDRGHGSAFRAYEKAGIRIASGPIETLGRAVLMECHRAMMAPHHEHGGPDPSAR